MSVLSIFIDESGDFGPYDFHAPFYIFSLVFHDQSTNIGPQVQILEERLSNLGLGASHCIHVGPIIRREEDYQYMSITERRRILNALVSFGRSVDIRHTSVLVEKRHLQDTVQLAAALSRQLSVFLREHLDYFQSFDNVIIYYDNGQNELSRILASVFSVFLFNVEFRKVIPANYRLFQVADMCCTFELLRAKLDINALSSSEQQFFGSFRDMKKNYLHPMDSKRFM